MATCPVPVSPVRSSIISVSVRSVIITGRIVARAVKHWHWKRNRESDENSSLGLRLEKHHHGKNKRKDQKKSSHRLNSQTSRLITGLPSAAFSIACGPSIAAPRRCKRRPSRLMLARRHDSLAPPRAPGQVGSCLRNDDLAAMFPKPFHKRIKSKVGNAYVAPRWAKISEDLANAPLDHDANFVYAGLQPSLW